MAEVRRNRASANTPTKIIGAGKLRKRAHPNTHDTKRRDKQRERERESTREEKTRNREANSLIIIIITTKSEN